MKSPQDLLGNASVKTDWNARWIWLPDHHQRVVDSAAPNPDCPWRNTYAMFRKEFDAENELQIHIAADTRYELYLDGERIARGTDASPAGFKSFDTYSLPLKGTRHVLAVLLHHVGQVCGTSMKSRPGLLVQAYDAKGQGVESDETWQCMLCPGYRRELPCMMSHFSFYQVSDYRAFVAGWAESRFDASSWALAEVIGEAGCDPWGFLIRRDIPQLQTTSVSASKAIAAGTWIQGEPVPLEEPTVAAEMGTRKRTITARPTGLPFTFAPSQSGQFAAFDFGREVTGHLRLHFEPARDGQRIDIGYDETLNNQGLPYPRRTYVHYADRVILRNGQKEAEIFDARGFRYLLLDVPASDNAITITSIELDERTYPLPTRGNFDSSDGTLRPLYDVAIETTRLCMLDTYVDCPSRERVLWMDFYLEALCSSYGTGVTQLWRRVLMLYARDPFKGEVLRGVIKAYTPSDNEFSIASYVMFYACAVSDYVQHTGDFTAAQMLLDVSMQQFEILNRFARPDGLFGAGWPSWQFIDWSAMDYGGVSGSLNAIFIMMHRKVARLARQLGKEDIAQELDQRRVRIEEAFVKTFWSESEQLFVDALYDEQPSAVRSQLTNVLAVVAGMKTGDEARALLRRIMDPVALLPRTGGDYRLKPGFAPQTGGIVPIGTPALATFLVIALFECGMDREALDYVRTNWPSLAVNGTFAEHFLFDNNTSFCHGWSAAPAFLFPRYILGAVPVEPGWKTVRIMPYAGDLQWAQGTIPTPLGLLRVEWKKKTKGVELSVDAPLGMKVVTR